MWWVVSLLTYAKEDAAWTTSGDSSSHVIVHNFCGAVGAWVADVSYFLFGLSVWWFVPVCMGLGWFALIQRTSTPFRFRAWAGGLCLLLCASTTLEWSWLSRMEGYLPNHSGGVLGYSIGSWSVTLLGFSAIGLIAIVLGLIGMALVFHFSWLQLSERLGANLEHFIQMVWQRLEQIRDRKLGKKAVREREFGMYEERTVMPKNAPHAEYAPYAQYAQSTLPPHQDYQDYQDYQDNQDKEDLDSSMNGEYPTWEEAEAAAAAAIQSLEQEAPLPIPEPASIYRLPGLELLDHNPVAENAADSDTLAATARLIEKRLGDLGVRATVQNPQAGAVITSYEITLFDARSEDKPSLSSLSKDLARSLSVSSIRVVEQNGLWLELPNAKRPTIGLAKILETPAYQEAEFVLALALGQDRTGNPIVLDLAKMPHILLAGASGSGQSAGIHAMICALLFKADTQNLRLLLIDTKMQKLPLYEGIPHLIAPIVADAQQAVNSLAWCVAEMEYRYQLMRKLGVSGITEFNQKLAQAKRRGELFYCPENSKKPMGHLPYVVVVVNELADLMIGHSKKVEILIACLAQKARATGIHLVLATHNPNVNIVTELIKANIPTRIAFQVSSKADSSIILETGGAETLLGMGDMLYLPNAFNGSDAPLRVHGAWVSTKEVEAVVHHIQQQCPTPDYLPGVLDTPVTETIEKIQGGETDPLYEKV
ncbi:MAG: hypothetical protein RIR79_1770, partial [Pseudomonadota bacterium]